MAEPVLCPDCGWTGTTEDFEDDPNQPRCPLCATDIEFVE